MLVLEWIQALNDFIIPYLIRISYRFPLERAFSCVLFCPQFRHRYVTGENTSEVTKPESEIDAKNCSKLAYRIDHRHVIVSMTGH